MADRSMAPSETTGRMIRVRVEDLMSKCKSKNELYELLTKCCKYL